MEALSAFGVNGKLLLIQGVNFALLLFILYRFLYRPVFRMLEERQSVIKKGLADAADAEAAREAIERERVAIIASAREDGGKIVENLRRHAIEQEKDLLRAAQEKSGSILEEARTQGEEERQYILRQSENEVARMAVLGAEKILRTHKP